MKLTEGWTEYMFGEANRPALQTWMSGLAVKQRWLAWMKTCKGLRVKATDCPEETAKTGDLKWG